MFNRKRIISIISTLLAVLMLASSMTMLVSAADSSEATTEYEYNTSNTIPTLDYESGNYPAKLKTDDKNYKPLGQVTTQAEKLEMMDLRLEKDGFRLYVDAYSGEVAVENISTGDVLFTNPYDVSAKGPSGSGDLSQEQLIKLLSQIHIKFIDIENNGAEKEYYSFRDAVRGGDMKNIDSTSQIDVRYIQGGIRVEYSIGRIDTRYLVPERIKAETFKELIYDVAIAAGCTSTEKLLFDSFFRLRDLDAHLAGFPEDAQEQEKKVFLEKYPEAADGPIYVLTNAVQKNYKDLENLIKKYCPEFTYEVLDEAHLALNYTPKDKNEALFKIALEYTIDEQGLKVRLPANGIRFDESLYRIEFIEILPYLGASANRYFGASTKTSGYTFFPDGSGALFDFEKLDKNLETSFYGDVYGEDFAYYNVSTNSPHNQVVRYPVFGLTENTVNWENKAESRGYLAVIEEGDSMMTLYSTHGDGYNTVKMQINPRPYDQYKLSNAISVAGDAMWTVVSERKYTGNVCIRYMMLTDEDKQTDPNVTYYDTDYVGMAKAYRDYLIDKGILTKLTEEDVKENLPLYIETFGSIVTTEKFLSVPYSTMKPLTSFGDIQKMYGELQSKGISNINFILTGYTDGGMQVDQVPYNLKWEKTVEKETKFEELVADAKEKGYGIYPDFDFVFASSDKAFDGLSLKKHAVMTIDGRYTSKREYSATRQTFVSYFELAISPAYFSHFYEKLTTNYLEYNPIGISVSSLGTYLNSDFDEDEPYHREDSKEFTTEAFKYLDEKYNKVMTSGGNAYSWKYVDYITDIATDSSRHVSSWATVPFLGIVLHGYVQTAGTPVNMEGNIDYAILRAIENGASLKFILSYRNTALLKEYTSTNMYYSVRYDIWVDDLVARYEKINSVLADVQTSTIEEHEFIDAIRISDADEALEDATRELMNILQAEIDKAASESATAKEELKNYRQFTYDLLEYVNDLEAAHNNQVPAPSTPAPSPTDVLVKAYDAAYMSEKSAGVSATRLEIIQDRILAVKQAQENLKVAADTYRANQNYENKTAYNSAKTWYDNAVKALSSAYEEYNTKVYNEVVVSSGLKYVEMYELVKKHLDSGDREALLKDYPSDAVVDELLAAYALIKPVYENLVAKTDEMLATRQEIINAITEAGYAKEVGIDAVEKEVETFNKYAVEQNSVVLEKFSNGKEIVLNFNSYAVKVTIEGVTYTVDAYGFIVIKQKGEA